MRTIILLALATALIAKRMPAEEVQKEPWQGSFTKAAHLGDGKSAFLDLPLPPLGKVLTIENVWLAFEHSVSVYSKITACEVRASHPKLQDAGRFYDNGTRLPLPKPVSISGAWTILPIRVHLYAENGPGAKLQLFCEGDLIQPADKLIGGFAGYVSPK